MTDDGTTTRLKPKVRTRTEKPRLYKVILLNDDFTPREFVTKVLMSVFRMSESEAMGVMLTAHSQGARVLSASTMSRHVGTRKMVNYAWPG